MISDNMIGPDSWVGDISTSAENFITVVIQTTFDSSDDSATTSDSPANSSHNSPHNDLNNLFLPPQS